MIEIEESRIITVWIPLSYRDYENDKEIINLFNYVYKGTYLNKNGEFENSFQVTTRMGNRMGRFDIEITNRHPCEYEVYKNDMIELVKRFVSVEKSYLMFKEFNEITQTSKRKVNG